MADGGMVTGEANSDIPPTASIAGPRARPPLMALGAVTALGPVSMHMTLPLLPSIARDTGANYAGAQMTVTTFLLGISIAQLAYGPWSDRAGRRRILIGGLALYVAASLVCALARTIDVLMLARFVQAVGSCAGIVISRAILRDCLDRNATASAMGYLTMTMSVGSLAAPAIGAALLGLAGWRACFWLLSGVGFIAVVIALLWIHETNPLAGQPRELRTSSYAALFRSRLFMGYALSSAFNMSSWYMLIAALPYLLSEVLGRPETEFAIYLPILLVAYILGNFIAGRFTARIGLAMAWFGLAAMLSGAAGFWLWRLAFPDTIWTVVVPMLLIVAGSGVMLPTCNAGAVSAKPDAAGTASGMLGFLQMALCAAGTYLLARAYDGTMLPVIVAVTAVLVATALMLALTLKSSPTP